MRRHTCDKCRQYKVYLGYGECDLMQDSNNCTVMQPDKAYGWDYEGYRAGVYVGPKFGCIHWLKKEKK